MRQTIPVVDQRENKTQRGQEGKEGDESDEVWREERGNPARLLGSERGQFVATPGNPWERKNRKGSFLGCREWVKRRNVELTKED